VYKAVHGATHSSLAYSVANESSLPGCMHIEEEDGVSSQCNRGRGKRRKRGTKATRALPMGKLPMYFVLGDLVFADRPREYHRWLIADGVHVCIYIYTVVARCSMVKDEGKRRRESYLEPRI